MKTKKLSLLIILLIFISLVTGCNIQKNILVTDLSLASLEGTGTENDPYLVKLDVDAMSEYSVNVLPTNASKKTLKYEVVSLANASDTDAISVSESQGSTLKIKALKAGNAGVKVIATDANTVAMYVLVTVEGDVDVLVRSIYFPIDEGDGTLTEPYQIKVAQSRSESVSFNVSPSNATNKEFDWTLGKIEDGEFVAVSIDDSAISLTPSATKLTFTGIIEGETAVIKGVAKDASGVSVYLQVTVESFTPVTSITSSALKEGDETDYVLVTSKNTKWDMTETELARKQGLIDGTSGPGGGQAADDMTYWPSLYNLGLVVGPSDSSDKTILINYSVEGIININVDGSYEALGAGTTIVTISSYSNPEVEMTIEVTVKDTIYPGILKEDFDNLLVSEYSEWDFDHNPDDLATRPLLVEWQLVQVQTNSVRGEISSDGNQKMFYLGTSDRVYGICLESNVISGDITKTTALAWNKVYIDNSATTLDITIGNNDKVHNQYRIVMVLEDGTHFILKDWTSLTTPNESKKVFDIAIPEAVKGNNVALVIEQRLTEKKNNGELHIKGIWINQYTEVQEVVLDENSGEFGQGSSFKINASVVPSNATDKGIIYSVIPADKGVSVDAGGNVKIDLTAETGEYTIYVIARENPEINASYSLTVFENVPTTLFELEGINDGDIIHATFHNASGVNHTDASFKLITHFNDNASNVNYQIDIDGDSVKIENNVLSFIDLGTSVVTLTSEGNLELVISFTVVVEEYNDNSSVITGINKTEIDFIPASTLTNWTTQSSLQDWVIENINKDHGGSKVAESGDKDGKIILEGHSTTPNSNIPINIVWNKVLVGLDINSFVFKVHSHDDDRVLESTNFRVRVINVDDLSVDELIGWSTVANRWKQAADWYEVSLDISQYQGKEIVIVIEQTGSLQNNGNWVLNSDSAAGSYLHLQGLALSTELANPNLYTYRLYANTNPELQLADGWYASAYYYNYKYTNYYGGAYIDGVYNPLVISTKPNNPNALALPLTSMFTKNGSTSAPMFYTWGLYPALNNNHLNNDVTYELVANDCVQLVDDGLVALSEGEATLKVFYKAYGSDTELVAFEVKIVVTETAGGGDDIEDPDDKTSWANKGEILADWDVVGQIDAGVGEGADLVVGHDTGWSALTKNFLITNEYSLLTFSARVFNRDGETYPHFVVKVNGEVVRAIDAELDYVTTDSDDFTFFTYDLSAYLDQTVEIAIGITTGTHAVVGSISFSKPEEVKSSWENKSEILADWDVVGQIDAGVGEGADLVVGHDTGWSALTKNFKITADYNLFTFSARVFNREGETYPKFVLKVNDEIVQSLDSLLDYVTTDSDDFTFFTYDLSAYLGQTVEVALGITTGTHAVVGSISFSKLEEVKSSWENKSEILADWDVVGQIDAGVGEGADLVVGHGTGWSALTNTFKITSNHHELTFSARVFHRDGETYPQFVLKVNDIVIRAIDAEFDYVTTDSDDFTFFTYDLSAYVGQTVEIALGITTGTHGVVGSIVIS